MQLQKSVHSSLSPSLIFFFFFFWFCERGTCETEREDRRQEKAARQKWSQRVRWALRTQAPSMGQNTSSEGTYARSPSGAATMGGVHKRAKEGAEGCAGQAVRIEYRPEPFQRPGLGRQGWGIVEQRQGGQHARQHSMQSPSSATQARTTCTAAAAASQDLAEDELPPYEASRAPPTYASPTS